MVRFMSARPALNRLARAISKPPPKLDRIPRETHLLYADRAIVAINKPSGLICQSDNSYERYGKKSAFDQLLQDLQDELKLDELPKQVHRLDKHTTGVYLLAKSSTHARALSLQFQDHSIKKTYLAIARGGRITFPEEGFGSVDAPIRILGDKVVVDDRDGDPTLTDWELLGSSEVAPLSLVRLTLHTGLKHQLRVHMAKILQAPILGDTLYSTKAPPKHILDIIPRGVSVLSQAMLARGEGWGPERTARRLFLHSAHVDLFRYRSDGPSKRVVVGISAPIPWYFTELCRAAKLDKYIPPEYVHGGLTLDAMPVSSQADLKGLDGKWLGPCSSV